MSSTPVATFTRASIERAQKETDTEPKSSFKSQLTWLGLTPESWTGFEMEVFGADQKAAGYRDAIAAPQNRGEALRLLNAAERHAPEGIFVRLNLVSPTVQARRSRSWQPSARGTGTTNDEIERRRAFFIDIDPVRGKTCGSATDPERELALVTALQVIELLEPFIRSLALLSSGNGWQVHVRLQDLPESPEVRDLIWGVLNGLRARFGTKKIKIDQSVGDARRLCPAAGSMKRKGDGHGQRPHRRSFFIPGEGVGLTLDGLRELHDLVCVRDAAGEPARRDPDARDPDPMGLGDTLWGQRNAVPIRELGERLGIDRDHPICPGCGAGGSGSDVAWLDAEHSESKAGWNVLNCQHDTCRRPGREDKSRAYTAVDLVGLVEFGTCNLASNPEIAAGVSDWFEREYGIGASADASDQTVSREISTAGVTLESADTSGVTLESVGTDSKHGGARAGAGRKPARPDADWAEKLLRDSKGRVRSGAANVEILLKNDPAWAGLVAWDTFTDTLIWRARPPQEWRGRWSDARTIKSGMSWEPVDYTRLSMYCAHRGFEPTVAACDNGSQALAKSCAVNVAQEWLTGIEWDGVERLDTWLHEYLGVEDNEVSRKIARRWLVQGAARILDPGAFAKYVLILQGPQDIGKSAVLRALAGERWFVESQIDITNKETIATMSGKLLIELAEGEIFNRASQEALKQWISIKVDRHVPKFARAAVERSRQFIIAVTVNQREILKDDTGSARWWPVTCGKGDYEGVERVRDQLWAEALVAYRAGERIAPRDDERDLFRVQAEEYAEHPVWAERVADAVKNKARLYAEDIADLITNVIEVRIADQKSYHRKQLKEYLRSLGYQDRREQEKVEGEKTDGARYLGHVELDKDRKPRPAKQAARKLDN